MVRVQHRALALVRRQRVPQLLIGLRGTIPEGNPNDVAVRAIQGEPHPDRLLFVFDKRPAFIHLDDELCLWRLRRFDRHQDLFLAT
jgi:hypothetical protein